MNTVVGVILAGAAAILTFDTVGSLAARRFGFSYPRLMPGSFLIYLLVGMAAASAGSLAVSAFAGAIVGLVEATFGWAISWRIGPGRVPDEHASISRILATVVTVTLLGACFGAVGGGLRLLFDGAG